MLDLLIHNATLPDGRSGMSVAVQDGRIVEVTPGLQAPAHESVDAQGQLLSPPFIDAHFHMDATLSYGLPRVNASGTLLEGIALWGELKPHLTHEALVARAITPDYALGGHTASLGLCWMPGGTFPGWPEGMAIGQHGSWNRSTLSGYKLVFVPFANGKPAGPPRDILGGFLAPDERVSYGRPVGVVLAPGGGLLMADDVGDVVWRVVGAG